VPPETSVSQKHALALDHYEQGRFVEAIRLLEALLIEAPSSELWNDWGTAQLAAGYTAKAAEGYARSLALEPQNQPASINYGVLLCSVGRAAEGKRLLEGVIPQLAERERARVVSFLANVQAAVASYPPPAAEVAARSCVPVAAVSGDHLNVLVIHEFLPHADRHGADVQWMQMLREFRAQGHSVTHIARSNVNRDRYAPEVERLGIRVLTPDAERMRYAGVDLPETWRLKDLLQSEHFDVAILAHWFWNGISIPEHYMEDIRAHSPRTFIAVLTDDQHGLRELQMARLTNRWCDFERSEDFADREMDVYRHADCVLTISDDDARAFLAKDGSIRTARMPMIAESAPDGPPYEGREGLIFLANFDNLANSDATTWFLREIWPLVRRSLPEVQLALVGNNLPDDAQFHGAGILRVGYAADLAPEFGKRRVAISPVRFGTGIKTKNLLALAHAVPVVTTTVGADGMSLNDGESALIADSPAEFAAAVVRAYTDDCLWLNLSTSGRRHIEEEFSRERMKRAVSELCEQARRTDPKPHDPAFVWSCRRVEHHAPACLNAVPAAQRPTLRAAGYVSLAGELAADGQYGEALAQLRHFYGLLHGRVRATGLTIRSMELAVRCYRALGNATKAAEYEQKIAKSCALEAAPNDARPCKSKHKRHTPEADLTFSVIVPTFDRQATLSLCLDALARQTFPADRFEVIVIDDGSHDGTAPFCRAYRAPFRLQYLHQTNAGAGSARRRGVQHSAGKFLLLINDDTIANSDLLVTHLGVHQKHPDDRQAVLGDFRFPEIAKNRALTRFLGESPFLFPQAQLERGIHWDYTKFVTCNTSIRRDAVAGVGSFDADFRLAEDSELGLRLSRRGYFVRYVPEARAMHQHLPFTVPALVNRAKAYGATFLRLLRKHPSLLGDGSTPYGWLDARFADQWREKLASKSEKIHDAEIAIAKYDDLDFAEFEKLSSDGKVLSSEVMRMFSRVVPEVYWHHFYASLVAAWEQEARLAGKPNSRPQVSAQRDVFL
jgi:O-antigen biosynthesis protein